MFARTSLASSSRLVLSSARLVLSSARPTPSRLLSTTLALRNAESTTAAVVEDIRTQLKSALKTAMKGRDKDSTGTIKSVLSDITYFEKSQSDPNAPASESHVIDVIRKAIDKRTQASQQYPSDHPNHSAFLAEINLLSKFLPKALSNESITKTISEIVDALTADERSSKSATGKVLEKFWGVVSKGEVADKKALGKMVAELLKKSS